MTRASAIVERVGARSPGRQRHRQYQRRQRQPLRAHETAREKRDRRAEAQHDPAGGRTTQRQREAIERERDAQQQPHFRRQLVCAIPEADRADEEQDGRPSEIAPVELAGGGGEQHECQRQHRTHRDARRVVWGQHRRERLAEQRARGVGERRTIDERLAGERGGEPVARLHHPPRDAERRRILRLPRIVPDEADDDPRAAQDHEPQLLQPAVRAGGAQRGRVGGGWCERRHSAGRVVDSGFAGGAVGKKKAAEAAFLVQIANLPRPKPQGSSTRSAGGTSPPGPRCP